MVDAVAYDPEGDMLDSSGQKVTEGGTPLTYENATDAQKASADIRWRCQGITYAADQTVTAHVSLTENGMLQVSVR